MSARLERSFVEKLMFGTGGVRRFTQDSPVLPDVWLAYVGAVEADTVVPSRNDGAVHLLLTPYRDTPPGVVRNALVEMIGSMAKPARAAFGHGTDDLPVIYNQSIVSAELHFEDVVRAVLPLTPWWKVVATRISTLVHEPVRDLLAVAIQNPENPGLHFTEEEAKRDVAKRLLEMPPDVLWLIRIVGAITLALHQPPVEMPPLFDESLPQAERNGHWRKVVEAVARVVEGLADAPARSLIYSVSLNRRASLAISRSSIAVKADAARLLFSISCRNIRWAVIDSGIDARHPAFRRESDTPAPEPFVRGDLGWRNETRVVATYDFSAVHKLLDRMHPEIPERMLALAKKKSAAGKEAQKQIERLKAMLDEGDAIDWRVVEPMLRIPHDDTYREPPPALDHGTHVAGILGGNWKKSDANDLESDLIGICPDIELYDIRVMSAKGFGGEFALMTAMQFVRWLNTTNATQGVHGANISLSIRHDVANYACGRTPVCEEAERLVASGVVVVAAAGNYGYRRYQTPDGVVEAYNSISIVDPGNADAVITVGATHRFRPHTYGVSYFSSRGPTGDGRIKPDLVAPGEKILAPIRNDASGVKDGTSMAAPHVSGAAALLMARHRELIGEPARIKKILLDNATDLGRERYFQGHGMLDVLRALQAV